jgi:NADP-dependent 3-hydroxy acid dehydrogenase YdfG
VALVTGGGSGIGLMATQALAVNGARVYITGRTGDKLQRVSEFYSKNIPGKIIPLSGDITSKDTIQNLVKELSSREKALDILINNAGISTSTQNTELQDPEALGRELFNPESGSFED